MWSAKYLLQRASEHQAPVPEGQLWALSTGTGAHARMLTLLYHLIFAMHREHACIAYGNPESVELYMLAH